MRPQRRRSTKDAVRLVEHHLILTLHLTPLLPSGGQGPEHPDTMTSRNSLATVLHDLSHLEKAEDQRNGNQRSFGPIPTWRAASLLRVSIALPEGYVSRAISILPCTS